MPLLQRIFLTLLLGLMGGNGFGQVNLVPNGFFEEYIECPTGIGIDEFLVDWFEPTDCTPDLYHDCGGAIPAFSVYPHSGLGMMRMYIWSSLEHREYAEVRLIQPLVGGEKYEFSVYIHLFNEFASRVGSFGAVLSEDSVTEYTGYPLLLEMEPSLQRDPNSIMNDTSIWYSYVDTFQAVGNEQFLTIGNFLSNAETPIELVSNTAAVYSFDDISLIHIEDTLTSAMVSKPTTNLNLYPNPNTGSFTLDYRQLQHNATLRIRNTLSQILFERKVNRGSTTLTQNIIFNKGIYLLELDDGTNCQHQYMVVTD